MLLGGVGPTDRVAVGERLTIGPVPEGGQADAETVASDAASGLLNVVEELGNAALVDLAQP
jgi:hypothetical protein